MKAKTVFLSTTFASAVALRLTTAALLSSSLFSASAAAVEAEKQPVYSNTIGGLQCGTDVSDQCRVPVGQRLIIDHVSGYAFLPTSANTTIAVSIVITDPKLGLNGLAFHTFVATKTNPGSLTDVFAFSTPFRIMLHPGATFYFDPADNVAVSGYLVK